MRAASGRTRCAHAPRSPAQGTILQPWRLARASVDGGKPGSARDHRSPFGLMKRRATQATAEAERYAQASLARVAEAVREVVLDEATLDHVTAGRCRPGRESIRVIPVAL